MSRQCSSPDLLEKHPCMKRVLGERKAVENELQTFSPDIFEEYKKLPSFLSADNPKSSSLSLSTVFNSPDLLEEYRSRIPVGDSQRLDEPLITGEPDTFSSETPVEATPETKPHSDSQCCGSSSNQEEQNRKGSSLFPSLSIESVKPAQSVVEASPLITINSDVYVARSKQPGLGSKLPEETSLQYGVVPASTISNEGKRDDRLHDMERECDESSLNSTVAGEAKLGSDQEEDQKVQMAKTDNRVKLVKSRTSGVLKLRCEGMYPPAQTCDKKPVEAGTLAKAKSKLLQMDFNYDYDSSQSQSQREPYIQLSAQKPPPRQSLLSDDKPFEQLFLQSEPKVTSLSELEPSVQVVAQQLQSTDTNLNDVKTCKSKELEGQHGSILKSPGKLSGPEEGKSVNKPCPPKNDSLAKASLDQGSGIKETELNKNNTRTLSSRTPVLRIGATPSLFSTAKGRAVKLSSASVAKSLSWLNAVESQGKEANAKSVPVPFSSRKPARLQPLQPSSVKQSTSMKATATAARGQSTSLFSTATGRKLTIKSDALERAKRSLESEGSDKKATLRSDGVTAGRTSNSRRTAISDSRRKALQVRSAAPANARTATLKPSLFSTAKGTPVVMSKEALLRAQNVLKEPEPSLPLQRKLLQTPGVQLSKVPKVVRQTSKTPSTAAKTPSLFATAKGTRVALTEAAVRKAEARLAANDTRRFETPMVRSKEPVHRDSILTVRKPTASLFSTAKGSNVNISAAGLERANKVLREINATSAKPSTVRKPARAQKKRSSKFVTPRFCAPTASKRQEKSNHIPNRTEPMTATKPLLPLAKQRKNVTLASLRSERAAVDSSSNYSASITAMNAHLVVFDYASRSFRGLGCEGLGWNGIRLELLGRGSPINERQASEKWVKNHYRWIVWKLHGLGRLFPRIPGLNRLAAEVVLQQLLQRYTREHVHAQRPALRKIMEHDMPYGSHIIVCVAAVVGTRHLIISDGWYGMVASIDSSLQALVARNRIVPGFKIHVCGASMKNNPQGIDPLDALVNNPNDSPFDASALGSEAMLCLTANCTKPAKWDTRMGWQKGRPLMKRLRSIVPTGGTVPLIKGVISRVYPLVFSEKYADGRRVVRNEREEEVRREEYAEQQRSVNDEVMQKLRKDWGESFSAVGEEQRRDMVDNALKDAKLAKRNVNRLLRFRLIQPANVTNPVPQHSRTPPFCFYCRQASHPSSACTKPQCYEAEVSIWNPSEDVVSIAKEGAMALGLNVVPNGMSKRLNLLRLTTSRWTKWRVQKLTTISNRTYGYVPRGLTEIGAIWTLAMTSSFDTVGCIAHVQEITSPETKKCCGYHIFLISNKSKSRPVSFTYHCSNVKHPPQGLITKGNIVAVRDLLFESVDPATGISACSFLSSSSFTSRRTNVSTTGWRHLADKFKELEAWTSAPNFAEEIAQASEQLATKITAGRSEAVNTSTKVISLTNQISRRQSPLRTVPGDPDKILPQKRKSMSKDEKKIQRLKVAQAKQAAWKKRHTKENNNSLNSLKRTEIRTNIKYELLSYIMLGKKSVLIRLRTGVYKNLKRGDTIHFQSGPQSQSCTVRTTQPYDTLKQLLEHEDFKSILPAAESKEKCMEFLLDLYSAKNIDSCGIVAIHLSLPN